MNTLFGGQLPAGRFARLVIDIAIFIFGIIFVANPRSALFGITLAVGILVLIYGVIMCLRTISGNGPMPIGWAIVTAVAGIVIIVFALPASRWLLPLAIGLWMIWRGITGLRGAAPAAGRSVPVIMATAELILGILVLVCMAFSGWLLGLMIGIYMLIYGVVSVYGDLRGLGILR